jgi:hypothetical protein
MILGTSLLTAAWSKRVHQEVQTKINSQVAEQKVHKRELDRVERQHARDCVQMETIRTQIKTEQSKEEMLALSLAVTAEAPPLETNIRHEGDNLVIGGLRIPRRRKA